MVNKKNRVLSQLFDEPDSGILKEKQTEVDWAHQNNAKKDSVQQ